MTDVMGQTIAKTCGQARFRMGSFGNQQDAEMIFTLSYVTRVLWIMASPLAIPICQKGLGNASLLEVSFGSLWSMSKRGYQAVDLVILISSQPNQRLQRARHKRASL